MVANYTMSVFDYNYGSFFIDFDNFSTTVNRNKYSTKFIPFHFNLTILHSIW